MEPENTPPPAGESPAPEASTPPEGNWVPLTRLNEVAGKLKGRITELEAAQARIAELEPLAAQLTQMQADSGTLRDDLYLADLGFRSEEGRKMTRALYGLQPEDERGTLAEWASKVEHPALQHYRSPTSGAAPAPPPAPTTPPPVTPPTPNRGAPPAPPVPGVTRAQLTAARDKWATSRSKEDMDAFQEMHKRFNAQG